MFDFVDIYARDRCSGKAKNSAQCQKPSSTGGLSIGLAVGIPVFLIAVCLGYFLFRNYRKSKKEDLEHDPDFDENGEATALPDFKPYQPNDIRDTASSRHMYEMEDPFDNRNGAKFPYRGFSDNRSNISLTPSKNGDPYVESFILPYHHQIGSKISLDEYARQIGEFGPSRQSYIPNKSTRNSSLSNINYLPQPSVRGPSVSPQKSNLKYENRDYHNVPDHTIDSQDINNAEETSIADSISNFEVNYENGNQLQPNQSTDTFNTTRDHDSDSMEEPVSKSIGRNSSPFEDGAKLRPESAVIDHDEHIDGDFDFSNESGNLSAVHTVSYENEHQTANTSATNLDIDKQAVVPEVAVVPETHSVSDAPFVELVPEPTVEKHHSSERSLALEQKVVDSDHLNVKQKPQGRKSPRISAFNLLKNDSDDEGETGKDYDENEVLSPEQEEELKRMKSVYKLYFDRENTIKRKDNEYEKNYEFKPDLNQPLPEVKPELNDQYLRINNELKSDTDYNKRLTTTSSIYTETEAPTQQYIPPQQQIQQYNHYLQDQSFQQFYQQHIQSLPPLQQLPNPSDFRKSTIQTYTDYQPRSKQMNATSPPMKQPFVPIENDNVWTSPVNSPTFSNNESFDSPTMHSTPSATQLSRSSVVMLNPVTEITKQRKFRPAGSLPSVHQNNHAYGNMYNQQRQVSPPQMYHQQQGSQPQMYHQQQVNQPQMYHQQRQGSNDFIPNSKGDVRKMMNNY